MSFLAGRLAAIEGSYFLHESKQAAGRLAQKLPPSAGDSPPSTNLAAAADVLPEILRHSIPIKGAAVVESDPSLSTGSKWVIEGSRSSNSVSADVINPLRAYVSLPQATFGPKRWNVPNEQPHFLASTANDLRRDKHPAPVDSEKLKAVIRGYSQIVKAFAVATLVVFGGATVLFIYTANKLELHSTEDIKTRGRDAIQPRIDMVKERMGPVRTWAKNISRKWRVEGNRQVKEKEFSEAFGTKTSN
ncbi:hypothetical protein LUZ60_000291 [Juncus effusus]|nr:hypothetical protein LUZ60_000291 [Juncus effusus]